MLEGMRRATERPKNCLWLRTTASSDREAPPTCVAAAGALAALVHRVEMRWGATTPPPHGTVVVGGRCAAGGVRAAGRITEA